MEEEDADTKKKSSTRLVVQQNYTEAEKHELVNKERFYHKLGEYYKDKTNKKPFTRESLNTLLEEVQIAKGKSFRKDRREYFILRTYDAIDVDGKPVVIRKNDKLPVLALEDLYDIIFEYHIKTNHGGKTKLEAAFKIGRVNVPRAATEIFLICCRICYAKRNAPRKVPLEKPKYVKGFCHKGQVDTIDFHSMPDKCYNVVLAYQDHYTKFLILRPLENDMPETIAVELLNIFMMFGAPKVLESHNGKYFVTKVLNYMTGIWNEIIFAHGEPKDSENPSRTPEDIENLIRNWMDSNYSTNWTAGLNFVQWEANNGHDPKLQRSPYQALFGFVPKLQLRSNMQPSCSYNPAGISGEGEFGTQNICDVSNRTFSDEDIKLDIDISSSDDEHQDKTIGNDEVDKNDKRMRENCECGSKETCDNDTCKWDIRNSSDTEYTPLKKPKQEIEEALIE